MNDEPTILTLDAIMAAPDIAEEVVEVPEWGGAVRIKGFTKAQQQAIRKEATLRANTPTQKAGEIDTDRLEMLMLVRGVIEPALEPANIPGLRNKSAAAIERILKAILRLSGLTEEAVAEAERVFQDES